MARPKVPDSQRQRAAVACTACRLAKKRCSATTTPCVYCRRRGLAASCSLGGSGGPGGRDRPARGGGGARGPAAVADSPPWPRPRMLQNLHGEKLFIGQAASLSFLQIVRDLVAAHIGPSAFSHNATTESMLEVASPVAARTDDDPATAAAAATTATATTATSAATTASPATASPASPDGRFPPLLDRPRMLFYGRVFAASVDGFLGLFARGEIEGLLLASASAASASAAASTRDAALPYRNPYKRATVALVLAIGAQCASPAAAAAVAPAFLRHAQQLLACPLPDAGGGGGGLLEDPSVDMVRAFLLLAWYMLGSCRRNAAYMYIGVAARAAAVLGLHNRDAYAAIDRPRKHLRLRIWASLCILDMTVSAILGRPAATAALRADVEPALAAMAADDDPDPDGPPRSASSPPVAAAAAAVAVADTDTATLLAAYDVLSIISRIADGFYGRRAIPVAMVERYLAEIEDWKRVHGRALQPPSSSSSSSSKEEQDQSPQQQREAGAIGRIHIACLYYFAVTLVTRPLLVRVHTEGSGSSAASSSSVVVDGDPPGPAAAAAAAAASLPSMAHACVDAATFLVQTCVQAQDAGLLLGNMCILKALVFIAGLILGLQSFADHHVDPEVEAAFAGARAHLRFLAVQSPQAAHYADILALLRTAIHKQRALRKAAHRRHQRYVSRLDAQPAVDPVHSIHSIHTVNTPVLVATPPVPNNVHPPLDPDPGPGPDPDLDPDPDRDEAGRGLLELGIPWTAAPAEPVLPPPASPAEPWAKDGQAVFDWDHLDITEWDDFYLRQSESGRSALDPDPT